MFPTMGLQAHKGGQRLLLQQQNSYGQRGFFHTEQPEEQQNKTKWTTLRGDLAEAQTPSWASFSPLLFFPNLTSPSSVIKCQRFTHSPPRTSASLAASLADVRGGVCAELDGSGGKILGKKKKKA